MKILGLIRIIVVIKTLQACMSILHKSVTLVILQTIVEFSHVAKVRNTNHMAQLYVIDEVVMIHRLVIKITNIDISGIGNTQ